jgi:DNA-binding Xre family transcriptional regulator
MMRYSYLVVRKYAEQQGLTAWKLARLAGLTPATIQKIWNNPQATIKTSTLSKIAQALKVPVQKLIEPIERNESCSDTKTC